jgi:NNP family nitrate/nitrite transporter-like MFS transporter
VQSGAAFVAMRAVIGCGLATFVCCQVWCSQQFSKNVVR